MLEFQEIGSCPKCGWFYFSDSRIRYSPDLNECQCSDYPFPEGHLELECDRCGFTQSMKTKDWKAEWKENFPPPPTDE